MITLNLQNLTVHSNKKLKDSKMLHKGDYHDGTAFIFGGNESLMMEEYSLKLLTTKKKDIGLKK